MELVQGSEYKVGETTFGTYITQETITKEKFIQNLKDKGLAFGWYNGEFVTID